STSPGSAKPRPTRRGRSAWLPLSSGSPRGSRGTGSTCGNSVQLFLQESPFGVGASARKRAFECCEGILGSSQLQQQLTAKREQQVILAQFAIALERRDRFERRRRPAHFRHRDGAIQRDDRRRIDREQLIVELQDQLPVE